MQLCGRTNGLLRSARSCNSTPLQRQTHALWCQRCCSLPKRKAGICIVTASNGTAHSQSQPRKSKSLLLHGVPLITATTWLLSCLPAASVTCQQQAVACHNGSVAPIQDGSLGSLLTAFVVLILLTLAVQPPRVKGPSRTVRIPGKWLNRILQILTGNYSSGTSSSPSSSRLLNPNHDNVVDNNDSTQLDTVGSQSIDAIGQGLTGTSRASVRSYVDMTSGQSREPGVVALRNQALATAATYSVCVAVKDCQPRVRKLLSDLTNDETDASNHDSKQMLNNQPAHISHSMDDSSGFTSVQDAALKQLVVQRLQMIAESGVQGQVDLSDSELNILQQQVMQAVAEQAAVEQIEALLDVLGDLHGDSTQPPSATGSAWRSSSVNNDTRQQQAQNQDIRGGGAH